MEDVLQHYGVLGMKWGVRRTPEQLGHKPKTRSDDTSSDRSFKISPELKRNIAIGVGATAAAVAIVGGVYLYKNYWNQPLHFSSYVSEKIINPDELPDDPVILPAGSILKRISTKPIEDYVNAGRIYVSHLKEDNDLYKWVMPKFVADKDAPIYQHVLKAKKEIRAPSERTMVEIYQKVFNIREVDDAEYGQFIQSLIDDKAPEVKAYYEAIKQAGFNAIQDLNDKSSTWAKSPLILLDPAELVDATGSHKVGLLEHIMTVVLTKDPVNR